MLAVPQTKWFSDHLKGGIKPQKQQIIRFRLIHCVHQPTDLERFFKVKTAGTHQGWQQTHILCTQACRYHTASCRSWEADVSIMSSPVNRLWTIIFHPETQQQIHSSVQFTMKHMDLAWGGQGEVGYFVYSNIRLFRDQLCNLVPLLHCMWEPVCPIVK